MDPPGQRHVRGARRNGLSLLYPAGLSARQLRADLPPAHVRHHVVGTMGPIATLEIEINIKIIFRFAVNPNLNFSRNPVYDVGNYGFGPTTGNAKRWPSRVL